MRNSLHSSWIRELDREGRRGPHLGPDALQDRIGVLCNVGIQLTQRHHRYHQIFLWVLVDVVPRAASAMSIALGCRHM